MSLDYNNCPRSNDIDNLDYKIRDMDFYFEKLERVLNGRMDTLENTIKELLERIIYLENKEI